MTIEVRLEQLGVLEPEPFTWQVPGLREDLATALIRSLPKRIRTSFVPAPDFARRAVAWLRERGTGDETAQLIIFIFKGIDQILSKKFFSQNLQITFISPISVDIAPDGNPIHQKGRPQD